LLTLVFLLFSSLTIFSIISITSSSLNEYVEPSFNVNTYTNDSSTFDFFLSDLNFLKSSASILSKGLACFAIYSCPLESFLPSSISPPRRILSRLSSLSCLELCLVLILSNSSSPLKSLSISSGDIVFGNLLSPNLGCPSSIPPKSSYNSKSSSSPISSSPKCLFMISSISLNLLSIYFLGVIESSLSTLSMFILVCFGILLNSLLV